MQGWPEEPRLSTGKTDVATGTGRHIPTAWGGAACPWGEPASLLKTLHGGPWSRNAGGWSPWDTAVPARHTEEGKELCRIDSQCKGCGR